MEDMTLRNKLTEDIVFNKDLIYQRIKQELFVGNRYGGTASLLPRVEASAVDIHILLARMRESLSSFEYFLFINNLTDVMEM